MRVKKGRSVDTGTLDRALKDALPVLLRQPAFQRQQVVCRLLCVSKNISRLIVSQCTGVLDVRLDAGRRYSFCERDSLPPSQQFAAWIYRHASLVNGIDISFESGDAVAKGASGFAAALQHVQTAVAAAAAATESSSTTAAAAASAEAAAVAAVARAEAAAVAAAARAETVAMAAAANAKAAAAAAATSAEAAAAAAAAASTAEAAAKEVAVAAQRQLSQATAARQHLPQHPEQISFRLQSFKCSISSDNCPAVLQQLPADHLKRLELHVSGRHLADPNWNAISTAVARLTGLQTLVLDTSSFSTLGNKLLTGALPHLTSLSSLLLSSVDFQLLCKLPRTLAELSLGLDSRQHYEGSPVAAPLAIVLTHLTSLTKLQVNQLRACEQLPASLQDLSVRSCYNIKPLLELTQLTGLSLQSTSRSYPNDEYDEYDHYDAYRDEFITDRQLRGPELLFEAIPMKGLSELTSLSALAELKLTYDRVESAEDDSEIWPKLPGLKSLHLRHTGEQQVEDGPIRLYKAVHALDQLTNLTCLRLAANMDADMSEIGSCVKQMTNLQELAVNNLWYVGPETEAQSLQSIFEELTGLQNLRRLECNMPITGAAAEALAQLTMLTSLNLTLTEENVVPPNCYEYEDSVDSQDLMGPSLCQGLKDKYLKVIVKGLRGLRELMLQGNSRLTEAGLARINKYLPRLKIKPGSEPYCMHYVAFD